MSSDKNAITPTTTIGAASQNYTYSKDDLYRLFQTNYLLGGQTVQKTNTFGDFGQLGGTSLLVGGTNILQTGYTYKTIAGVDFSGQIESESIQNGAATAQYSYVYDTLGNITKIRVSDGTTTTDLYRYVYDEASQLIREDNASIGKTTTWQYDVGGNIRTKTVYPMTAEGVSLSGVTPEDTIAYGYESGVWKDQLSSYDGQAIAYDANGNPTSYLGATLTWTMGRQLESYTKGDQSIQYTYNENGIRTSKTINGVRTDYYLNGSQVIAEVTNDTRIDYRYDGDGKLIALRYNGTEYYTVTNIQGDILGLIDSTGTSVVQYSYDAWGNPTSFDELGNPIPCTGTLANTLGEANPYRYRGYRVDRETGLYYLQSRYYDAAVGRFINADDLGVLDYNNFENIVEYNLFAYCENNSVMLIDNYGYHAFTYENISMKRYGKWLVLTHFIPPQLVYGATGRPIRYITQEIFKYCFNCITSYEGGGSMKFKRYYITEEPYKNNIDYVVTRFGVKTMIDKDTKVAFLIMQRVAALYGINISISYPYRTPEEQKRLYGIYVVELKKYNEGLRTDKPDAVAAPPGAHQTGRALDIFLGDEKIQEKSRLDQQKNLAFIWLDRYAKYFGFYGWDKLDDDFESWHWVYNP